MAQINYLERAKEGQELFNKWEIPFRNWRQRDWDKCTNEITVELNELRNQFKTTITPLLNVAMGLGINTGAISEFLLQSDGKDETLIGVRQALGELVGKLESGTAKQSTGGDPLKNTPKRKKWTKDLVVEAVEKYLKEHNADLVRFSTAIENGTPYTLEQMRSIFGRNEMAEIIGCAEKQVGNTRQWKTIAINLKMPLKRRIER